MDAWSFLYMTYLEFVLVHLQHSFGQEAAVDSHQSQAQWEAQQSQGLEEPGKKKTLAHLVFCTWLLDTTGAGLLNKTM